MMEPLLSYAKGSIKGITKAIHNGMVILEQFKVMREEHKKLREDVIKVAGNLQFLMGSFTQIDKRIEMAVELAVRKELERLRTHQAPPQGIHREIPLIEPTRSPPLLGRRRAPSTKRT
jgi:hypothetical protein